MKPHYISCIISVSVFENRQKNSKEQLLVRQKFQNLLLIRRVENSYENIQLEIIELRKCIFHLIWKIIWEI